MKAALENGIQPVLRNNRIAHRAELSNIDSLNTYIQAATSENTRKAYRHDIQHFIAWGGVLPTTADVIIRYLINFSSKLNPRTLIRRLTAIKNWHLYQNFPDPTSHPLVRKTLTGIKNIHGRPKEKALALQIEDLIAMVSFLTANDRLINWRNNAILQVGFFGAFRRSELVAIQHADLHFVSQGVKILIPRSKTDQTGEGQICAIPNGDTLLCPSTALKIWCQKANIENGPVFRRITKGGKVLPKAIDANHLSSLIKKIAQSCALPNADRYSGHSLRRGFATAASQQGISLSAIMQQGRWKHAGTAIGYMEDAQHFETNAAGIMMKARSKIY
jgi:integrase